MDLNSRQYVVSLDMTRTGSIRESFEMRHNDDNELIIELRDSAGIIDLNASGVINATLLVTRKDKVDIPLAGTITPEGRASFKLKRASLEKQGMVEVVAQFYFANDVRISTPTLIFNVLRDPSAGAVGDEGDDRTLIEIILNDAPVLLEQLQTAYDELVIQKAAFSQFQSDSETAFSNAQNQRLTDFNADQTARSTAFEDAQTQRSTDFNTSQGERANLFNQAQTARQTDYTTWKDAKDTELNQLASDTENSKLAADGATANANNAATAANAAATNANNKVTELNVYNTRLQGVETETSDARQSTIKGKNFANVDARFEELEGDTYRPIRNDLTNSGFSNGFTGWSSSATTTPTVVNGEATFTATGVPSSPTAEHHIYQLKNLTQGNKYYASVEVLAQSTNVKMFITNSPLAAVLNVNVFERLSALWQTSITGSRAFGIRDESPSGWQPIKVRKFVYINLTEIFGAGKEPSKEEMDELLTVHYDGWFDGTANVAKKLLERSVQQLIDTFVPMKNEVVNGDFRNGTAGWSGSSSSLSASNNTLSITGDNVGGPGAFSPTSDIGNVGDKYYSSIRFRVTNSDAKSVSMLLRGATGGTNVLAAPSFIPAANTWYMLSGIAEKLSDWTGATRFSIYVGYLDGATAQGKITELQNVAIINLTKTFGKGNEPTKEEMDRLLAKYPNSFFDGTVNLTPKLLDDLRYLTGDVYMPMTNQISNGDMSQGTTGWSSNTGLTTVTSVNGKLVNSTGSTLNGSNGVAIHPSGKKPNIIANNKYYLRYKMKPFRTHNPAVYIGTSYFNLDAVATKDVESIISSIVVPNTNGNTLVLYDNRSQTIDMAEGLTVEYDDILLVDLTVVFGAGNEPTQAQMDALIATYPNGWFDGTVNLAENKRIIPFLLKRLEMKADKAQEAWITPTLLNGTTVQSGFDVGYMKDALGFVHLKGCVNIVGTLPLNIFALPTGYRVSVTKGFAGQSNNSNFVPIYINTAGQVLVSGTNKTAVFLDGITFKAEA